MRIREPHIRNFRRIEDLIRNHGAVRDTGPRHELQRTQRAELHSQVVRVAARLELEIDGDIPVFLDFDVPGGLGPVSVFGTDPSSFKPGVREQVGCAR